LSDFPSHLEPIPKRGGRFSVPTEYVLPDLSYLRGALPQPRRDSFEVLRPCDRRCCALLFNPTRDKVRLFDFADVGTRQCVHLGHEEAAISRDPQRCRCVRHTAGVFRVVVSGRGHGSGFECGIWVSPTVAPLACEACEAQTSWYTVLHGSPSAALAIVVLDRHRDDWAGGRHDRASNAVPCGTRDGLPNEPVTGRTF